MSIKLFGHRVLLKHEKLKNTSTILVPDVAGKNDLHRMGRVMFVGDGKVRNPVTKEFEVKPSLVNVGDLVMFQINDVMKWAQIYRHLNDDTIHMIQGELIARIHNDSSELDNFEILGDFLLVKPEVKKFSESILLPDTIRSADMIHYTLIQKGSTVDLPLTIGNEVICNHGRINPIFIPVKQPDGPPMQIEYGYVYKDFVHGTLEEASAPLQT